jgi:hypothetical protein
MAKPFQPHMPPGTLASFIGHASPFFPADLQLLQGNVEWNPGPQSREACEGSDPHPTGSVDAGLGEDEPLAARAAGFRRATTTAPASQPATVSPPAGKKRKRGGAAGPSKPRGGASGQKRASGRKAGTSVLDGISAATGRAEGHSAGQETESGSSRQAGRQNQADAGPSYPTELDEEELLKQQRAESCWNAAIKKVGSLSDKSTLDYERGLKTYKVIHKQRSLRIS